MSSISEKRASSWADLMAVFWVQQLFTLPVIYEHLGMGDELPHRRQPTLLRQLSIEQQDVSHEERLTQLDSSTGRPQTMEFERLSSQQFGVGNMASSPLNMGQMANALPDYRASNLGAPSFQQSIALQGDPRMYQYPTNPQFAGQSRTQYDQTFNQQYPIQLQQQRPSPPNYSQAQGFAGSHSQNQQQFPSYYGHPQPSPQGYTQYPQGHQGFPGGQAAYNPGYNQRISPSQLGGQMRQDSAYYYGQGAMPTGQYIQTSGPGLSRHSSDSSMRPSAPRGPPRKPKQSGHALWVGNLPPGTHVADLKDHFSRDATKDIESVFLISKSNCAFVNYKTDSACSAAMARFHDSRFQGVRLVCRLRRGSAAASSGTPVGPSSGVRDPEASEQETATARTTETTVNDSELEQYESSGPQPQSAEKVTEKFFVVKSLTVEDLDLSVRNGIWATQAHNEAGLNKAYETAENVYLIFSANKSGEYYGYARMSSAINENAAAGIEVPARSETSAPSPGDMPSTIPTPATETAPKGRIIDDSARGTIFWEAEVEAESEEQPSRADRATESDDPEAASPAAPQSFGKPFKIEWLSTDKLPFYRTRGLRNPWNANREVKIARDGTELEPNVGRRLISMFHRPQNQPSPVNPRLPPQQGPAYGYGMGYMPQAPQGRPY